MAKQKQLTSLAGLVSQAVPKEADEALAERPADEVKNGGAATSSPDVFRRGHPSPTPRPSVTRRGGRAEDIGLQPVREKGKVGRKPTCRTIQRKSGMSIFFEDAHREALRRIGEFDKQDIIRAALDQFLLAYTRDGHLTPEGREILMAYVERTTDRSLLEKDNEDAW